MTPIHRIVAAFFAQLFLAAFVAATPFAAVAQPAPSLGDPVGSWEGAIDLPGTGLEIRAVFVREEARLGGTLDIPAQGLMAFQLDPVSWDGDTLRFVMPGIPGEPTFEGTVAVDRIEGTFTQGGQAFPFHLDRVAESTAAADLRPQEPRPPFPYLADEVTFASGDVTLAGTLTLPPGEARVPAVVLITGSGPQDRDEAILGHKPFLLLADLLTRAGVAVLRVDDRGVGGSTGSDVDATYDDLAGDVEAGLDLLAAHPRIDAERIGLLGHSQGGYLAPYVAARRDDVAFVVIVAGPAVDGGEVLQEQSRLLIEAALRRQGADAATIAEAVEAQSSFLRALQPHLAADDLDGARALVRRRITDENDAAPASARLAPNDLEAVIVAQQAAVVSVAYRSFLSFDPRPSLQGLAVPVLAIYGSLDLQVGAEQNVPAMRAALAANPDATVTLFEGLNHLMQPAVTGLVDEYASIDVTMDERATTAIVDWVVDRTVTRAGPR